MAQVKVWNENLYEYKEKFKGMEIKIPPRSFILMEADDADQFYGSYSPIKADVNGRPTPQSFKKIRIEQLPKVGKEVKSPDLTENKCLACAYVATSKVDLDEHVTASHLEQMTDEEEVKKRRGRPPGSKASAV